MLPYIEKQLHQVVLCVSENECQWHLSMEIQEFNVLSEYSALICTLLNIVYGYISCFRYFHAQMVFMIGKLNYISLINFIHLSVVLIMVTFRATISTEEALIIG
jgi:hypothetical protein